MWNTTAPGPSGARTLTLFPAIVRHQEFGDTADNQAIYRRIKQFQQDPSIANALTLRPVATIGGYQPEVVLHERLAEDSVWQNFFQRVVHPAVQAYLAEHHQIAGWPVPGTAYTFKASWAVLYPREAYQAPHNHGDIFCVLAYYARVPERPRPEGAITFVNPHPESCISATRAWDYHCHFQPRAGTTIVFPGWLQHYSHPHHSDDERLLLTVDIALLPK